MESLNFINERPININFKKQSFEHSTKSKIFDFVKEYSPEKIHKLIISKTKNETVDLKKIIYLTEIELQNLLNISNEDFKKYTVINTSFVKLKKRIFLKLIEYYKLEENSIFHFLNDINPNYKNIEKNFKLIEKELSESEINAYYFLNSIIDEKPIKQKLKMII
ncbi:hypothetical protein EC396_04240 [Lutibacter sp. HS1-25]|uniref:hypothetical protein n=1 Tax=Lutibacter sp. HS1-25 TaxID=2485000 RepID=UPI001011967B|nr:hypothetical protein [Lutibacter sp. HS1-25]RXP60871.1 hypothetical protein EC396_04240 [Lutibacter sp. HS1-25]